MSVYPILVKTHQYGRVAFVSNGILIMNQRERDRLDMIKQTNNGSLTRREAARLLSMSERNFYRILARYTLEGDKAVIHRMRGQGSNRGYGRKVREDIFSLHKALYDDYGPTLFAEMLLKHHHYAIDHDTLRRWFREENIPVPAARKARKHRRKRERRSAIGELVQFDGSPHDWFEGRGPECCLLHGIDDASNQTYLRFAPVREHSRCDDNSPELYRTLRHPRSALH